MVFFIHILDPYTYEPYFTSLCILQTVIKTHPKYFDWKSPPYEYEYKHMPIDLIIGRKNVRLGLKKLSTFPAEGKVERRIKELYEA